MATTRDFDLPIADVMGLRSVISDHFNVKEMTFESISSVSTHTCLLPEEGMTQLPSFCQLSRQKAPDLTLWFLLQLEYICSCYPVDLLLDQFTYLNVQLGSQTLSPKISRLLYLLLSCSQKLASALIPLLLAVLYEFN